MTPDTEQERGSEGEKERERERARERPRLLFLEGVVEISMPPCKKLYK